MENLLELISGISWPTTVLVLLWNALIYVIDNINTSEVERRLMSNFERYKFVVYLSLVSAFIISVLIVSVNPEYPFINFFIFSLFVYIIILTIAQTILIIMLKKYKFYIEIEEGEKWEIIKKTNDKGLLLKQEEKYKVIKDYYNMTIIQEEPSVKTKDNK